MKEKSKKYYRPTVGNAHIAEFLEKSLSGGDLSGSYIFTGADNLGKTTAALFFVQALLCKKRVGSEPCGACPSCKKFSFINGQKYQYEDGDLFGAHSDFYFVRKEKEKKNISIEQIRELIQSLSLSSFLDSYKIGIIKHAHLMSEDAANALLKTLEEPRKSVIIILIVNDVGLLPETIVSRSKILRFNLVSSDLIYNFLSEEMGTARSVAKNYSRLSAGRPALAIKFAEDRDFLENYLSKVNVFLDFFKKDYNDRIDAINDLLATKASSQEVVGLARRALEVWEGMARDMIFINYGEKNLVQHEIVRDELEKISAKFNINSILKFIEDIKTGRDYLNSNVNPKNVLENIAISI